MMEKKEIKAEILDQGVWTDMHGTEFTVTEEVMQKMVANFEAFKETLDVFLKFGHNDEQPMTDGQPMLGRVGDLWIEGKKLFAKFVELPPVVYDAIKNKLYNDVSIEAMLDVKSEGVNYGTVLTAVSLLGSDMPAVNTLADLQTFMSRNKLAFSGQTMLSKHSFKQHSEESTMTPEEEAKMQKLEADLAAKDKIISENAAQTAKLSSSLSKLEEKLKSQEEKEAESVFLSAKKAVEEKLESLVKENKILPAQRDKITAEITKDNLEAIQFTVKTLESNTVIGKNGEQGKKKGDEDHDDSNMSAGEKVAAKAAVISARDKVSFSEATRLVFKQDPSLAREYADENDQEVA